MIELSGVSKSYSRGAVKAVSNLDLTVQAGDIFGFPGVKQKLAIIAALIHDPDVFILDEPMSGLDPKSSFVLKEKMREMCDRGKTVFFSTHVMDVAERLCDRVGIIRRGTLIACAPFSQLHAASGDERSTLEQVFLELTDEHDTHTDQGSYLRGFRGIKGP